MKINLIIFISEFNLGGAGNSIFKLCKNLPKNEFIITVICLKKCFYKAELIKLGIKVYEIPSSKTFFGMFKIKKIVKRIIKKNHKNIFLSNIHFSNVLSILFLKSLNIKMILVERTPFQELLIYYNLKDFLKKTIIKLLIKFYFPKADACIANSKYISNKYNKIFNLKFKTINPPSFKKLSFSLKKNKKDKKKICIGIVSRLSREKKIDKIIKIIPEFNNKINLEIIGDGLEKQNLKQLVNDLKLNKNILFLGAQHPNKIKSYMKNFDYFINTSDFEGFPNSVVEALSTGTPIIASQSFGGINDILSEKKFGYIYNNISDLKSILKKIINNKIYFKLNKKKLFNHLSNFSEERNLKNYIKLFKNI